MISESYTDTAKTVRHRRVKLRLAIAVIIAATAALATGGTILLKHWDTFAVKENDKYSVILISDAENSPQCITRYYEPDLDKTAYATRLIEKTEYAYIVEYINKHGKQADFYSMYKITDGKCTDRNGGCADSSRKSRTGG